MEVRAVARNDEIRTRSVQILDRWRACAAGEAACHSGMSSILTDGVAISSLPSAGGHLME
jgi:hypothetical protein